MKSTKIFIIAGIGLMLILAVFALKGLLTTPTRSIIKQEALEKVRALPEVGEFVATLERNGKAAAFNIEDQGGFWSIQVYEMVVNGEDSHTATFNWYNVDKSTGDVKSEFE